MNKYLEQLVTLARLDQEIDDFVPTVESIQKKLKATMDREKEMSKLIVAHEDEVKEFKLKKSKNELHLAELSDKLAELSKKSALLKTDREIKALQLEEEIAKEQCDFANDEIARFDKLIEAKKIDIQESKEKIEIVAQESLVAKVSIETQMQEIEGKRGKICEEKQQLLEQMSQKILTFYEKIRKWAGNTTVVPVKKQACYGCFMRINDKTYANVIKHDDIITCPHCGRILYKEFEEVEA